MNPFRYGQVVSARDFCPRPKLINHLMGFIKSGQNVVLQGERRMGKTSLIHEAVRKLKHHRMLYVDLMEVKAVEDVCKRIVTAIISMEHKSGFLEKIMKSLSQLRPVLSLDPVTGQPSVSIDAGMKMLPNSTDGLLDLIADLAKRKNIAVVFDEFQDVLNLSESAETLASLRSKIQFHSRIPYLFAGSVRNDISSIFTDPDSAFFKSALLMEVASIDEKSFIQFLKRKFASGSREVSTRVLLKVIEIADAVSGDVQEFCGCLWEITSPGDKIEEDRISPALELIYARESKGYENVLVQLTGQQFKCLTGIARFGGKAPHSSDFRKNVGIGSPASVQKSLNRILKLKIIYRYKDKYKFVNPFLKSWLNWKNY